MNLSHNFAISVLIVILLTACVDKDGGIPENEDLDGQSLALQKCSPCHLAPEPELLSRESWEKVLPAMAEFMGIYSSEHQRESLLGSDPDIRKRLINANIYPEHPIISTAEYEAINDYYLSSSKSRIEIGSSFEDIEPLPATDLFTVRLPDQRVKIPSTTMSYIRGSEFYIGDANTGSLSIFDSKLKLQKTGNVTEGAVWINFYDNAMLLTVMGSFSPTEKRLGMLMAMPTSPDKQARVLIDGLHRPVHTSTSDIDKDGDDDLVISEFGYRTGSLSLYVNDGLGGFQKKTLYPKAGAICSEIRDYDGDGDLDIIALIGQSDEGIYLYTNNKGSFSQSRLLRFPPSYGSSYFTFSDTDGDNIDELIYCNGDNADLSQELKSYHGTYIYEKDGEIWKERVFLPQHGAYKAIAEDFDGDGDKDVASIAFFPDFNNSIEKGFIYYENIGTAYVPHTLDISHLGRWITLDSGDPDGDWDTDLVLGSLMMETPSRPQLVAQWMEKGLPFIMLENQKR
jgi:hypothetical protein